MRAAFKEWAVVVDALGHGGQILILRKGGISEGRGGFQVAEPEFLLFPTRYHQQQEAVIPSAQGRWAEIFPRFPPPDRVRLEYFARVVAWHRLEDAAAAAGLRGQHIWRDEVVAARFDWGREKNIHALAVRVWRLAAPVELPMQEAYGGCKSWLELAEDVDVAGATPVLADEEFAGKLAAFHAALAPSLPRT